MYRNVSIIAVTTVPTPTFLVEILFTTKTKMNRNRIKEKRR